MIENLADKAKLAEYNDLAIVLYTYLGSEKAGMSSEFARHCQTFAKDMSKHIKMWERRDRN